MRFHVVIDGSARIRVAGDGGSGGRWEALGAGAMVLLPRGHGHVLASVGDAPVPCRPLPTGDGGPAVCVQGRSRGDTEGGADAGGARVFWAGIDLTVAGGHPLLRLMPPLLRLDCAACRDPALPALIEMMADEAGGGRPGGPAVLARLAEVVIARMIRVWFEAQCEGSTGWVAAIRDPRLARALAAIHRHPERPWPVEALAGVARASRSAFAERFSSVMGMSPARYVAQWRMHRAGELLRGGDVSVAQAAHRMGYESVASFSRAFKRVHGIAPGALRDVAG